MYGMITIFPADADKTKELAARAGESLPLSAMVLREGETEYGYVLYRVEQNTARLITLHSDIPVLEEGLVRAMLNAAANEQAVTAVCRNPSLFPLLKGLGFSNEGECYSVFIPDFFTHPCPSSGK